MPEQVTINCPHCGFRRTVPLDVIPAGARQANCPKCKQAFDLTPETMLAQATEPQQAPAEAEAVSPRIQPQPGVSPQAPAPPTPRVLAFSFQGTARDYFGIWIVNTLLKIVTVGIYSAWAKVRRRRFFYGSTTLHGQPFEYLADPLTLFKGWLIAALALLLYAIGTRVSPILSALVGLTVFAAFPWLVVRSRMFNSRNSSHRNIRFGFRPDYRQAYLVFAGLPLLTPFTLGLLAPYMLYRQKRFMVENSCYGVTPFSFNATAKDFYKMSLKVGLAFIAVLAAGAGLTMLAGGGLAGAARIPLGGGRELAGLALLPMMIFPLLYFVLMVYAQTQLANLTWNGTTVAGNRFRSTLRARDMAWLFVSNAAAIACSLGLLMPWATVRMTRYRFERLEIETSGGLDGFLADARADAATGAAGEEIGDLLGLSTEIGL